MNALTKDELAQFLDQHRIKPRLKRELRFTPEAITDWEDRDFLTVVNRSNSEGVLVLPGEEYLVVPFALQPRKANASGRTEAIICDFCATWQRGSNSAVISFEKENSTQSFLCCGDLNCSLHVRGKTSASKLSRTQLRENISPQARIGRLQRWLSEKLRQADDSAV